MHETGREAAAARSVCTTCGGDIRFSHREYGGGARTVAVFRCRACGAVKKHAPMLRSEAAGDDRAQRGRSRKHRSFDEGPPVNPVLDPETAARLRGDRPGKAE